MYHSDGLVLCTARAPMNSDVYFRVTNENRDEAEGVIHESADIGSILGRGAGRGAWRVDEWRRRCERVPAKSTS